MNNNAEIDRQVTDLYDRIHYLLSELGIRWSDLARLIDLNPKTLSSMRCQRVNPSWTTVLKIARALDVSVDELIYDPCKTDELYEFYWSVPRVLQNNDVQSMTCKQCITVAYVTGNGDVSRISHRIDVRKENVRKRLAEIKATKKDV